MMDHLEANDQLISAFVECQRQKTHTYNFPVGECTLTLKDVAFQLGARVDSRPITGSTSFSREMIENLCQKLLDVRLEEGDIQKSSVKLTQLFDKFFEERLNDRRPDVFDEILQCYTHGYILRLLGIRLKSDKGTSLIYCKFFSLIENLQEVGEHNRDSICHVVFYRNLCRATCHMASEIGVCLQLLQSWTWHQLLFLAPVPNNLPPYFSLVSGRIII